MRRLIFVILVSSLLVTYAFVQKGTSKAVKAPSMQVNMSGFVSSWSNTAVWNYFQMDTVDTYAFPVVGRGRNDSTYSVYFAFPLGERKSELWEYTWNPSKNNFTTFNAGNITNLGASGDISIGYGRNDTTLRIYVAKGASGIIEEYTWDSTNNNYTISQLSNLGGQFYTGPWVGRGRNDSTYRVYIGIANGTAYELTWNGIGWDVLNMGSIENFTVRGVSGGYGRNDSTVRVYFGGSGSNAGIYEFSWNQTNNNYTISKILDKPNTAVRPPEIGYGRNDTTYRIYACDKDTGDIWELTWNGLGWDELFVGSYGTGARRVRIADGRNDGMNRLYVGDSPTIYELTWNAPLGNFSFTGNITTEAGIKWIWVGPGRNDSQNRIYVNNEQAGAYWLREYSYPTGVTSPTAPSAPQNLQATAGNSQVTLTWSAPASDGGSTISWYNIYRGASPGGEPSTPIGSVSGTILTYTDTGLTNGVTYYYKVTAVNSVDESPPSNEASATPTAPLTMHVSSINMWYQKVGSNYKIYTKVTVVDTSNSPVSGATVYLTLTLPSGSKVSRTGVTGTDGTVTFVYGPTKKTGTYTSTITNVTKDGWTYDSKTGVTTASLKVP